MTSRPPITPDTKVGDLLSSYPELEAVLVAQAPAFANLKNPILRRTVAKVATLAQAARVGGVDVRELVRTLRAAAGLQDDAVSAAAAEDTTSSPPAWFREDLVVARVDADQLLARGEHPLGEVTRAAQSLEGAQIVTLESGFLPAPLIDAFRARGYEVAACETAPSRFLTCLRRVQA